MKNKTRHLMFAMAATTTLICTSSADAALIASESFDYAARDTANHFIVMRFDFGVAENDTVTIFNDPTLATNFAGSGSAQLTGIDATFDGVLTLS